MTLKTFIAASLFTIGLALAINESDQMWVNLIGAGCIALGGYLFSKWDTKGLEEYSNEFIPTDNDNESNR